MSLSNKVAIVTGGSSGIGAAIAVKFAEEGAKVVIVGRNENKLANVEKEVAQRGSKPLVIAADVTREEDAKRIVDDTLKHFGRIDVLVNNAGIARKGSILDPESIQIFDEVLSTNLRSIVYLTHLAAPHVIATKGNIINMSSAASFIVFGAKNFMYSTAKAGLDHFTRCIALELAEKGVRANCINPGPVKTDIYANAGADAVTEAASRELVKTKTALNKISDAEEVADLTAFVASDKGRSITGATLLIDNGFVIKN